jgi:hypothetical protein
LSGIFLDPPGDVPPSVRLASPIDGSQFTLPTAIPIEADASDSDSPIAFVELFINGQLIRHLTNAPYGFAWSNALQGSYTLTARAVDNLGESQTSDPVMITATLPKAAAEFVGTDSTTHGDWIGRYGFNGFAIPSYVTNYPSFASVSVTNAQVFIWQNPSDDGGALQYTNTAGRIASCWFDGETVGVVVDLLDGLDHKVSLYFLDLEGVRNLGIDVIDPADGSLLDTRSINDAGQGLYYSWIVQGRVGFQITRLTANAVLSGVFLDPLIVSSRAPRLSARQNNQSEPPGVQFELRGVPNYPYRIESSTNLADWSLWQVQVASPSGRITFLETLDTDSSERFYRAILLH